MFLLSLALLAPLNSEWSAFPRPAQAMLLEKARLEAACFVVQPRSPVAAQVQPEAVPVVLWARVARAQLRRQMQSPRQR